MCVCVCVFASIVRVCCKTLAKELRTRAAVVAPVVAAMNGRARSLCVRVLLSVCVCERECGWMFSE